LPLWPTLFLYSLLLFISAVGRFGITCAAVEYVSVNPPGGQSCQQYLGQYINQSGGYITNPDSLSNCQYCSYRTTDQFLESNSNIFYSHHWRNFAFLWIYIGFNVRRRRHFRILLFCGWATNSCVGAGIRCLCYDVHLPHSWTQKSVQKTAKCQCMILNV
jgi:hypothetical protein